MDPVHFFGEFRELTGHVTALVTEHMRNENELVAVCRVSIDKVVEKRPFKTCAHAAIDPKSCA